MTFLDVRMSGSGWFEKEHNYLQEVALLGERVMDLGKHLEENSNYVKTFVNMAFKTKRCFSLKPGWASLEGIV